MTAQQTPAPVTATAEVRRQGPYSDSYGRPRRKFGYHAIACQPLTIGGQGPLIPVIRAAGEALCGAPGPWEPPPDGLFAAPLGCVSCARFAAWGGITILGLPDTEPSHPKETR